MGEGSGSVYDEDWQILPFFISTQMTGFEIQLLKRLDAEILIGQITYNQSCDIYNHVHRYGVSNDQTSGSDHHHERYVNVAFFSI